MICLNPRAMLVAFVAIVMATLSPGPSGEAAAAQAVNEGCSVFMPCGAGLSCMPFRQVCHRDSGAREGEACQAGYGCAAGLTCEAGSQVCRGPAKSGEACHLTRPCAPGLSCQPGVQRCYAVPRAEGEPCSAGFGCGPGLQCEAGSQVCRAAGKVGDACHVTRPCGAGLSCQPGVQRCYHDPRQANEPCVAGFGCAAGLSCTPGKQVCEALAAKQCITNAAGYSAKVEWWKPTDLTYEEKDGKYTIKAVEDRLSANSVKTRQAAQVDRAVTLGFSSCNNSNEQRTAVVWIEGGKYVNGGITTAVGIVVGAVASAATVGVCVGSVGTGCAPAVAGSVAAVSAATGFVGVFLPDAQEIAFIGTPATTKEVKLTGTVWSPTWEYGTLRGGVAAQGGGPTADTAKACRDAIQDKVAWSRSGAKRWQDSNLNALCQGAINPTAIASCVTDAIKAHDNWSRAIADCKGR